MVRRNYIFIKGVLANGNDLIYVEADLTPGIVSDMGYINIVVPGKGLTIYMQFDKDGIIYDMYIALKVNNNEHLIFPDNVSEDEVLDLAENLLYEATPIKWQFIEKPPAIQPPLQYN